MLLSFRLALQQLKKRPRITLRDSHSKFGSPDSQAGNRIVAFGLRQHSLGSGDVGDRC